MGLITRRAFDPTGTVYPNYLRIQHIQAAQPTATAQQPSGQVPTDANGRVMGSGPGYAAANQGDNRFLANGQIQLSSEDPNAAALQKAHPNQYVIQGGHSTVPLQMQGSGQEAAARYAQYKNQQPVVQGPQGEPDTGTGGGPGNGWSGSPDQKDYIDRAIAASAAFNANSRPNDGSGSHQTLTYAEGGTIAEPVIGIGMHSGKRYLLGEKGTETVTPGGESGGHGEGQRPQTPRTTPKPKQGYLNREYLPSEPSHRSFSVGDKNYTTFQASDGTRHVFDEGSGSVIPVSDNIQSDAGVADGSVIDSSIGDYQGPAATTDPATAAVQPAPTPQPQPAPTAPAQGPVPQAAPPPPQTYPQPIAAPPPVAPLAQAPTAPPPSAVATGTSTTPGYSYVTNGSTAAPIEGTPEAARTTTTGKVPGGFADPIPEATTAPFVPNSPIEGTPADSALSTPTLSPDELALLTAPPVVGGGGGSRNM
jgi:hypothetical protein